MSEKPVNIYSCAILSPAKLRRSSGVLILLLINDIANIFTDSPLFSQLFFYPPLPRRWLGSDSFRGTTEELAR